MLLIEEAIFIVQDGQSEQSAIVQADKAMALLTPEKKAAIFELTDVHAKDNKKTIHMCIFEDN